MTKKKRTLAQKLLDGLTPPLELKLLGETFKCRRLPVQHLIDFERLAKRPEPDTEAIMRKSCELILLALVDEDGSLSELSVDSLMSMAPADAIGDAVQVVLGNNMDAADAAGKS
ncbi:hypothetical protein [Paraferrimonas haliotis]|uniref:Uncharacterized protein n=1 Tax=Paraferrimonas haliotis TaxID=2013866 RepID=A0AA37TPJ7_9GAMM|nr:hypothetical protein [Paraferrimonas haliotis]GLS83220.1 hypothetical protein GCM10007894_11970 [Paraferrimonas haliotis]